MQKIINYNCYLLNIFFALIPGMIILGNFAINLNIFILIILTSFLFFSSKDKFKIKINFFDKLVLIFFLYTIITLIINYLEKKFLNSTLNETIIVKTILYQRYLVLYFLIRILLQKKILQLEWFNRVSASCVIFVCIDIIIQFLFGKDIFGITPVSERHYSGLFGSELIAGGYIQKFSLFVLVFWQTLKKNSILKKNYIFIALNILILISIILSGNRMPLVLFLFSLILYAYFNKNIVLHFKKIFLLGIIIFFIFFQFNKNLNLHFKTFIAYGSNLINVTFFKDLKTENRSYSKPYEAEFNCSKIFIKENPFFGGGIRSYRTHSGGCSSHSHNYYLEILVDLGLTGLIIILFIMFFISKKIKQLIKNKKALPLKMMPFLIILIIEFFPARTSGSLFNTNNSIIIFTFLAILFSQFLNKKDEQYRRLL